MKKFILKLDLQDDKEKRKALKTASALPGIDEISIDIRGKKLTVIGTVDPITVVSKLRKIWPTDIVSVEPAKEPEKKEEPKEEGKEESNKEEPTKEEAKKEPKQEEEKKAAPAAEQVVGTVMPYRPYYAPMQTYYYVDYSMEEDPNACVIC